MNEMKISYINGEIYGDINGWIYNLPFGKLSHTDGKITMVNGKTHYFYGNFQ